MSVVLIAELADHSHRRLTMRPEQSARIGNSPWIELCLNDPALCAEHFEIRYAATAEVMCLDPAAELTVGADRLRHFTLEPLRRSEVRFQAGTTLFRLACSAPKQARHDVALENPTRHVDVPAPVFLAVPTSWATELKLQPDTCIRLANAQTADQLWSHLLETQNYRDALRLVFRGAPLIQTLPAVLESMTPHLEIGEALNTAINQWLAHPEESTRKHVEDCRRTMELDGFRGYLADSIRFSGGSIAEPDQPVVPPPAELPALALEVSLQLARVAAADIDLADLLTRLTPVWLQSMKEE